MKDRKKLKERITSYLLILFGTFLTSLGIALFYAPNNVVSGGVSGMAIIVHQLAPMVSTGIAFAVINFALLLVGIRVLGKKFIIKTLIGSSLVSVMVSLLEKLVEIIPEEMMVKDIFLATVIGAALYGFGISMTFVGGASTGGTDILGRILQHYFPHLPIGKLILIVDAVVIGTSLVLFRNIENTLYGIIALFIASTAIDYLMRKLNVSKLAFVVTEKGEDMAKFLTSNSPRGVTVIDVKGGYTFEDKKMLVCALKEKEVPLFEERVKELDDKAFTIFSESSEIIGNGFYLYR